MANPRIYLWIAVALLLWMNLVQWNRDYGERSAPAAVTTPARAKPATDAAPPATDIAAQAACAAVGADPNRRAF
jgi:hypothetical protein